jgi:hypothetical protein
MGGHWTLPARLRHPVRHALRALWSNPSRALTLFLVIFFIGAALVTFATALVVLNLIGA